MEMEQRFSNAFASLRVFGLGGSRREALAIVTTLRFESVFVPMSKTNVGQLLWRSTFVSSTVNDSRARRVDTRTARLAAGTEALVPNELPIRSSLSSASTLRRLSCGSRRRATDDASVLVAPRPPAGHSLARNKREQR
jgi:hypothetical protein